MSASPENNTINQTSGDVASPRVYNTLTQTARRLDIVHITLAGMGGIVLLLYLAVLMPMFGFPPIQSGVVLSIIGLVAIIGIVVLYKMNIDMHKTVTEQARLTEVLVNSLGQGFLIFGRDGVCGSVYSQACLDLLNIVPAGKPVHDVLHVASEQKADFYSWIDVMYDPMHALGFDDAVRFLPDEVPNNTNRVVKLTYRPIRDKNSKLLSVVVIATDRTEEMESVKLAKEQQEFAEMICKIFIERNQFNATVEMVREFITIARKPNNVLSDAPAILRHLHTLKSGLRHFSLRKFADIIHKLEDELRAPAIDNNNLFSRHLNDAAALVEGELNNLLQLIREIMGEADAGQGNVYQISEHKIYAFAEKLKKSNIDKGLSQEFLEEIVAVPVRECFRSFEREVQELAAQLDKKIKPIVFAGDNPKVLTRSVSDLFFSLTHIARNIVDHGIESQVTRLARCKDAAGQITITSTVSHEAGRDWLTMSIEDDGGGIDPSKVRQRLALMDPNGNWRFEDDQAIIQKIFNWGVSTKENVSLISGRGVGLEAVDREVSLLGGTIKVTSEIYKGAKFIIRIPYSVDLSDI